MKTLPIILPIIAVILISGCTVPGFGPTTGNGLVIEDFKPDFPDVSSGQPVQLQLKVRNTGSVDAPWVIATIHGIDTADWNKEGGCEPEAFSLLSPDPRMGTAGGTKTCIWYLTAPDLPKGLPTPYNPIVRLDYKYESITVKSVTLLPLADARRLQNLGLQLPAETLSSTSGPVQLTITTKGPIRVFDTGIEFPLEIQIQNVGGGTVCHGMCDTEGENWNKLPYTINLPTDMTLTDCDETGTITLFRGQTNTITCTVRVTEVPTALVQKQIKIRAGGGTEYTYYYFIDQSTSIRVTGA